MCLKFLLLSMRSKSIRIFKSKSVQHNHWNEWIENINISKYHLNVNVISIEKKFNSNQWSNNEKCWCECKKHCQCEKGYIWNTSTFISENGKYLTSIMHDSGITCAKIIESSNDRMNLNENNIYEKS